MQKTIYKYQLPLSDGDIHKVRMPTGAQVLHIGTQGPIICLWAMVSPLSEEYVTREFQIIGTGILFEYDYSPWFVHIGTVQMVTENERGTQEYVWHVFERMDPDAAR
jgi:hypothetical protein